MMEIERKWILQRVPTEFRLVRNSQVEQFYVSTSPEVRLRHNPASNEPFRITIKGEGTLAREEIETKISENFYNQVKEFVKNLRLRKIILSLIAAGIHSRFLQQTMELLSTQRSNSNRKSRPATSNFLLMMQSK